MKLRIISWTIFTFSILWMHAQSNFQSFVFVDTNSFSELSDVLKTKHFKPIVQPHVHSNFSNSTYWIKIVPSQPFHSNQRIGFGNAYNHYETIYFVDHSDAIVSHDFGINQVYSSSTFLPSFQLNENIKYIYIKIKSDTFLTESFIIANEKEIIKRSSDYTILQTASLLFVLLIFLYITYLYTITRRRILKKYAKYVLCAGLMFLFISNAGRYYLWNQLPFSMSYIEGVFSWLMVVTYVNLTINITQIKAHYLWMHRIAITYLYIGSILMLFTILVMPSPYISMLANILPTIALLFILLFSVIGISKRNENSLLYLIGVFSFISGVILRLMINWGTIEYSIRAEFFVYSGVILEFLIFTYVVVKHIESINKITQEEKDELIANALQIEKLQSSIQNLKIEIEEQEGKLANNEITNELNSYLKSPLTKRELEVLIELSKGGQHNEVAERLHISIATLKTHVSKVYTKLDSKNRIDAINTARELIAQG